MFKENILNFNTDWNHASESLDSFTDMRELQNSQGVELMTEVDESTTGPASFMAVDPHRNTILVDQHI